MDILYLLIPLSAVLVLLIIGVFGWAVNNEQFEDLEREGRRVLDGEPNSPDGEPRTSPNSADDARSAMRRVDPPALDTDQAPR